MKKGEYLEGIPDCAPRLQSRFNSEEMKMQMHINEDSRELLSDQIGGHERTRGEGKLSSLTHETDLSKRSGRSQPQEVGDRNCVCREE
jgi:hypothetical protein